VTPDVSAGGGGNPAGKREVSPAGFGIGEGRPAGFGAPGPTAPIARGAACRWGTGRTERVCASLDKATTAKVKASANCKTRRGSKAAFMAGLLRQGAASQAQASHPHFSSCDARAP
jgi:hypothetical protein